MERKKGKEERKKEHKIGCRWAFLKAYFVLFYEEWKLMGNLKKM